MDKRKRIPAKSVKKKSGGMTKEAWGIILIALGLIALFCFYTEASKTPVGQAVKSTGLGIFGIVGYLLPVYMIAFGVQYLIKRDFAPYKRLYLLLMLLMILASSMVHLLFGEPKWDFAYFYAYHDGGGILGGLLSTVLVKLAGSAIAGIVLAVSILFTVLSVTKHSLSDVVESLREKIATLREKKEKSEKAKEEPVKKTEKKETKKITAEEKEEEPFDFDAIKIYTHDQMKMKDFPDEEKPAEEKPSGFKGAEPEEFAPHEAAQKTEEDEEVGPPVAVSEIEAEMKEQKKERIYIYPSTDLLEKPRAAKSEKTEDLRESAKKLIETLKSFGVDAKILEVTKGPNITRYELQPSAGVKVSKIVNLADDIALNLAATGVRIEAPIPGKAAVGIEVPNKSAATVTLREMLETAEFRDFKAKTAFAVGKDISGGTMVADLSKMPHLLIAGATGSGKSVCINTLIASLIYKAAPEDVRLLMIDPKVVELKVYNGLPHLLIPVVTDPRKAAGALNWAVTEMLRRYKLFSESNVRNLAGYNEYLEGEGEKKMESIIVIVDELADLMMAAPHEVEDAICRLAQMGRAAGIHLVIATQRPSVDVITGLIKANIPSRIAFAVASQIDSRTILDMMGAEKLLGKGDMLYLPYGASKPIRLQGAFISDKEVEKVVEFVKGEDEAEYDTEIMEKLEHADEPERDESGDSDDLLSEAIEIVVDSGQASVSMIQRRLKVGYSRAGRIIDQMEARGIIGPHEGAKPRQVLITKQQFYEMQMHKDMEE
ncbi:MAG: DNA translocase FtsK [Clostridia bacterium]|nr:DNA translocase FtsK [Clostridia bacterium]